MEFTAINVLIPCLDALNVILRIPAFFAQTKEPPTGEPRIYKHVNMNVELLNVLLVPLDVSNVLQK